MREERQGLIKAIEEARGSRVLTYVTSDRPGAAANISDDAIRSMAEHVRTIGRVPKLDLFLYSRGGSVDAPWPIVCLLREYCDTLGVLIPFRAHSAATLIALGCDEIVMTRQAELGPIDPALNRRLPHEGTLVQEEVRVEDVMAYVGFLKDKAGLGDQSALAASVGILAQKLGPQLIGSVYRTHSHIRAVARKLLSARSGPFDEQRIGLITETLAEKTYSHGHAIGRKEARDLGLPLVESDEKMEGLLWNLLEAYEARLEMRSPLDLEDALAARDEAELQLSIALVESVGRMHAFRMKVAARRLRQPPAQVQINLNINLGLPAPNEATPPNLADVLLERINRAVSDLVRDQVRRQSPAGQIESRASMGSWRDVTAEDY
ncbi:MAG: hypothetical protein KJ067_07155 [Vicinamibacteria bacterium]|nr:hypothetical protein [Vicinamibacteria bacterium]